MLNNNTHSRSPSASTSSSHDHDAQLESGPVDSTTRLILEPPDHPSLFLSFDDDDANASDINNVRGLPEAATGLPPGLAALPVYAVQLFLVSPSLLLGATFLQDAVNESGKGFDPGYLGVIWAGLTALLACLANQIWVLSGRYVRKWSIEEIVAHALVGGSTTRNRNGHRELWRKRVILTSRSMLGVLAGVICLTYLHDAATLTLRDAVEPTLLGHAVIVLVYAAVLTYLMLPTSMASRRLWLCAAVTVVAHSASVIIMIVQNAKNIQNHGLLHPPPSPRAADDENGSFLWSINWDGLHTLAFTFASPLLVYPLYISRLIPSPAAFSAGTSAAAKPRRIPFPIHTLFASLLSVVLLLPLLLISPSSSRPHPFLRAVALVSGIPPLWVLALRPRLPSPSSSPFSSISPISPSRTSTPPSSSIEHILRRVKYSHTLWALLVFLAIFAPPALMRTVQSVLVLCVLFTGFALPALLHVALHMLLPPLAILVGVDDEAERRAAGAGATGGAEAENAGERADGEGNSELSSDADALLRRKERSLQRRRLGRRILWDLAVFIILLPLGLVMCVWSAGRVVRAW